MADADVSNELLDYEEEEEVSVDTNGAKAVDAKKGSYAGIHSSGFRDFLLKPELLRAIVDCGFEHPSEVQQECIPQAILKMDVICQGKAGMGKTAVFVLAALQQLEPVDGETHVLVLCHTRELAYQIQREFERFCKYMPGVHTSVFFGGLPIVSNEKEIKANHPHIVVATPGRLLQLAESKKLSLKHVKHFVLDECDKMLEQMDMRRQVQDIFKLTPHDKQVMMFSATLSADIRPVCKKFMQDAMEIYIDDESKLTLHGLQQYYCKLNENEKNKKVADLLDALDFNQVVIFVKSVNRCIELTKLLTECNFPATCIHGGLPQPERIERYQKFKNTEHRLMVATDIFGRGMDVEKINVVINYDMPADSDSYLHRVARAGRFGTKGLAVTFVSSQEDGDTMNKVQERLELNIAELPAELDVQSYMNA